MKAPLNSPVLNNFASPLHCLYLQQAGLDVKTPFFWKIKGSTAILATHYFDEDGYYKQAAANVEMIDPISHTIPAFQIAELQIMLGDYSMDKHQGIFYVTIEGIPAVIEERQPDALATALKYCLKHKLITSCIAKAKIIN